jgi:hypothetical protein
VPACEIRCARALMRDVMRHSSLASLFGVVVATVATPVALGCSPALPLKTLTQNAASADHVYLAKLVTFKRSPLPGDPHMKYNALEEATFHVLQTIKGAPLQDGEVRTRTEVTGGTCTLSLRVPYLEKRNGKVVPPKLSGKWLLVLSGREPYSISNLSGTAPAESIPASELRSILKAVGNASGSK